MTRATTLVYDDALEVAPDVAALIGIEQFGALLYQRRRLSDHVDRASRQAGFAERITLRSAADRVAFSDEIGAVRAGARFVYLTSDVVGKGPDALSNFLAKLAYSDVDALAAPEGAAPDGAVTSLSGEALRRLFAARSVAQRRAWFVDFPGARLASDGALAGIASAEHLVAFLGSSFYSRVFNHVAGAGRTLVKRSADATKMKREHDWWYQLPPALQRFAVQPYGFEQDARGASYRMERLAIPDFAVLWVHGPDAVPDEVFDAFLDAVFEWFAARPVRRVSPAEARAKADALYVHKVEERTARLLATDVGQRLDAVLEAGGRPGGVRALVDRYLAALAADRERTPPGDTLAITHGDLCFSNVLYDKRSRLLRFVDPRGATSPDEVWDEPTYDLAKLSHSILGSYDFVNSELFDVVVDADLELVLRLDRPPGTAEADERREAAFLERVEAAGVDAARLRLYEASLFLSMLPLHAEAPRKLLAFVLRAEAALEAAERSRARTPSRLARWLGAS